MQNQEIIIKHPNDWNLLKWLKYIFQSRLPFSVILKEVKNKRKGITNKELQKTFDRNYSQLIQKYKHRIEAEHLRKLQSDPTMFKPKRLRHELTDEDRRKRFEASERNAKKKRLIASQSNNKTTWVQFISTPMGGQNKKY